MTPQQDVARALAGETIIYQCTEFEANAPSVERLLRPGEYASYQFIERRKVPCYFDESLKRLRERGFDRHPRPAEAYSLFIESLERKLSPEQEKLEKDMLTYFEGHELRLYRGEFLSLAIEQVDGTLVTYLDPEGLVFQPDGYGGFYRKAADFHCAEMRRFPILRNTRADGLLPLDALGGGFTEYICGRPYESLPAEMREGFNRIRVCPGVGVLPVGFGTGHRKPDGIFDLVTYFDRGSRGVRKADATGRSDDGGCT